MKIREGISSSEAMGEKRKRIANNNGTKG